MKELKRRVRVDSAVGMRVVRKVCLRRLVRGRVSAVDFDVGSSGDGGGERGVLMLLLLLLVVVVFALLSWVEGMVGDIIVESVGNGGSR